MNETPNVDVAADADRPGYRPSPRMATDVFYEQLKAIFPALDAPVMEIDLRLRWDAPAPTLTVKYSVHDERTLTGLVEVLKQFRLVEREG